MPCKKLNGIAPSTIPDYVGIKGVFAIAEDEDRHEQGRAEDEADEGPPLGHGRLRAPGGSAQHRHDPLLLAWA